MRDSVAGLLSCCLFRRGCRYGVLAFHVNYAGAIRVVGGGVGALAGDSLELSSAACVRPGALRFPWLPGFHGGGITEADEELVAVFHIAHVGSRAGDSRAGG